MADEVISEPTGTAADIFGGAPPAADPPAGDPPAGDPPAGDPPADSGVDPDWYSSLSAEADGDNPSLRDWVKAGGVKDLDSLAKIARDNQKALRENGRVKIPGEGAKPEEIAEYRKAIGVPDDAKGYSVPEIKDADGNAIPLNDGLLAGVLEDAHAEGLPKAGVDGLVAKFIQRQLDEAADIDNKMKADAEKHVNSWGTDKDDKMAAIDRAATALGITRDEMVALRNAWGPEKALDRLVKLGQGMAEDVMITGGKGRFGISGIEAKQEIARLKTDTDFQNKLMANEPAAVARWNRLNEAEAAYEEAQRKAA